MPDDDELDREADRDAATSSGPARPRPRSRPARKRNARDELEAACECGCEQRAVGRRHERATTRRAPAGGSAVRATRTSVTARTMRPAASPLRHRPRRIGSLPPIGLVDRPCAPSTSSPASARATTALVRSGVLRPERPDRLWRMARRGPPLGPGARRGLRAGRGALRRSPRTRRRTGPLTFAELDARTDADRPRPDRDRGASRATRSRILCRNHRYFFEITGALAKLGANALYLNTGFAAPQVDGVMQRERAVLLVHDDEFDRAGDAAGIEPRLLAWTDPTTSRRRRRRTLDDLAAPPRRRSRARSSRATRAARSSSRRARPGRRRARSSPTRRTSAPAIALLERLPYRAHETMVIAAPCFHTWGFANATTSLLLGDTMVLERQFDPEHTLALIARHRAEVFVAVPGDAAAHARAARRRARRATTRRRCDSSRSRVRPCPAISRLRFMDAFGDVIHNLYGSTEVGSVSVATPADLRAAPDHRRPAAARHTRPLARRATTTRSRRARTGASSCAGPLDVLGLHRRRLEGGRRRIHAHRRHRALRRRRPPVRRRPRRRR